MKNAGLILAICMFIFVLSGCNVLINPKARISVKQEDDTIENNGIFDFGEVYIINEELEVSFTILSKGRKTLKLTDSPTRIRIEGADASEFVLDEENLESKIGSGKSTEFLITFSPKSIGFKQAEVSIESNDDKNSTFKFTITGSGIDPEISVFQENTEIFSGSSIYSFEEMYVGFSNADVVFTIRNSGNGALNLSGQPEKITISGSNASDFELIQNSVTDSIEQDNSTTFSIRFEPTSVGNKSATISIANNDRDENPFVFSIVGFAINPGIVVTDSSQNAIVNHSGVYDFGGVRRDETITEVFSIKNLGTSILELTGSERVALSGSDSSAFAVVNQPNSVISPGGSSMFIVEFLRPTEGDFIATITIENNDIKDNPYEFTIKAKGIDPEINIHDSLSNNIVSGTGVFEFNNVNIGQSESETFTIQNLGTADLNLTGTPLIEILGEDISAFTIVTEPDLKISPSADSVFTIKFEPTIGKNHSATISIANDDFDENPYTFTIEGVGVGPEINVKNPNDEDIPDDTGTYNFGKVLRHSTATKFFTIENLGNANLVLSGSQKVSLSGSGISAFSVSAQPSTTIEPEAKDTFTIQFKPTLTQVYSVTVTIVNNDFDENPYTFTIIGYGEDYITAFDFNGDGINDSVMTEPGYTENGAEIGAALIFLGRSNLSSLTMSRDADVIIIGSCGCIAPAGDFNGDGYSDLIIGSSHSPVTGTNLIGMAYIFFGSSNPAPKAYLSSANVKYHGIIRNSEFGCSVASARDFNRDGFDDVIIGAKDESENSSYTSGSAFIFFGSGNPAPIKQSTDADVRLYCRIDMEGDFGISVSSIGDYNNDGYFDVIVGDYYTFGMTRKCRAYIFFGSKNPDAIIQAQNANIAIHGLTDLEYIGDSMSCVGDVNNDGFDDCILGARGADSNTGSAYIFYGKSQPTSSMDISDADVVINGEAVDDEFGYIVANAGDINNDGFDDFMVSSKERNNSSAPSKAGCVYIFLGNGSLASSINASSASIIIECTTQEDYFGCSLSALGDFNNDGVDDFIIGAIFNDSSGTNAGCVYYFWGKSNFSSTLNPNDAVSKIYGSNGFNSCLGARVAGSN